MTTTEKADPNRPTGKTILKKLWHSSTSNLTGGGGLALLISSFMVNITGFLLQLVLSRLLGPYSYGALIALFNITNVVGFSLGAVQVAITQTVAEESHSADGKNHDELTGYPSSIYTLFVKSAVVGAVGMVGFLLFGPTINNFLHLNDVVPVIWLGLWVLPSIVALLPLGVLLGEMRFKAVAVVMFSAAITRLVVAIALVEIGMGINGAMLATLASVLISCLLPLWLVRHRLFPNLFPEKSIHLIKKPSPIKYSSLKLKLKDTTLSIVALGGYWMSTSIDTFLTPHFLSHKNAGYYAAAVTTGRIVLFLPAAIAMVAFPRLAAAGGRGAHARRTFIQALTVVAALSLAAAVVIALVPHLIINILFGNTYPGSVGIVTTVSFAAVFLSVINPLIYLHLARRSHSSVIPWVGVLLATGGISVFHSSPETVAIVMLITSCITMLLMFIPAWFAENSTPAVSSPKANTDLSYNSPIAQSELDFSVVIPFYNPGPRFRPHVRDIIECLASRGVTFEVLAVSDGSTDNSEESLKELEAEKPNLLQVITYPTNQGKGEALRIGLSMAKGRYLGFIDADGDIPASQLANFICFISENKPDIAYGNKRHPNSKVNYSLLRRLYSWGYQDLIKLLFSLDIADTQSGIKFIKREVIEDVLPRMVEKRFAFDLELFVVAKHLGYNNFSDLPIEIVERFGSTVSPRAVKGIILDTLAIFYRLKILKFYSATPRPAR